MEEHRSTNHRMKRITLAGGLLAIILVDAFLDVFLRKKSKDVLTAEQDGKSIRQVPVILTAPLPQ